MKAYKLFQNNFVDSHKIYNRQYCYNAVIENYNSKLISSLKERSIYVNIYHNTVKLK